MRSISSLAIAIGLLAFSLAAQQPPAVRVPTSVLQTYVGEYLYPDGSSFKVALKGDTLVQVVPGRELAYTAISETLFMLGPNFTAEFVIDQAGGATQILSNGTSIEIRLRRKGSPPEAGAARVSPATPTVQVPRSVLERYVGVYEYIPGQMNRTDLRVVIRLEGDTLTRDGMGATARLIPTSDTTFKVADTPFGLEFVVDDAGVTLVMGTGFQQVLARKSSGKVVAPSPEVTRLQELLAVVNTGDAAAMQTYLRAHSVDQRQQSWSSTLLPMVLELYRLSGGLELVRTLTIGPQDIQPQLAGTTVGILRNKATGDQQALAIIVEPQSPHRIMGLPVLHPTLAAFLAPAPVAPAQRSEQEQLEAIGAYLQRIADADIFSGAVIITRDGRPVFSQAYGYADRDKKIANTLSTPFMLGSINKLFTGLAIGQLVEQGKLSYDDPLSKFLPDYPDAESATRIKIKHLLSHTSGLGDYSTKKAYRASLDRMHTVQALIDIAGRDSPAFAPGTKWAYSNTGFVLLGRIIEIVTGQDYYDYMRTHVFAPAGMTHASFPIYPKDGVATVPMAYPYEVEFDGQRQRYVNKLGADYRRASPSGVGIASALDFVQLANALQAGRVVKAETFRLHASPKPELGSPTYGYGVQIGARMAKRPLVGHGGNAFGQCTEFGALTDTPYTLVVLSNLTIGTCMSVTGKILQILR